MKVLTRNELDPGDCQRVPIKCWTDGVELDGKAEAQLRNVASLPFIHKHVAVMPDVHWGMGCTVGSVVPTKGAIVPAAVGVDIGCGMVAAHLNLRAGDLPDSLAGVRSAIEAAIPHGRTDNGGINDKGAHQIGALPRYISGVWTDALADGFRAIVQKHPAIEKARTVSQLGTLGTGNHFIELCLDESDHVWLMLHSGSRGVGNKIGSYFIERAREHMKRWFINVPDVDLAYLPEQTQDFDDYIQAVGWAQKFAEINRSLMLDRAIHAVSRALGKIVTINSPGGRIVNCHHNYVARENHYGENVWVTRKGAVRAREGDFGIIPGSMGACSYIVRGRGNPESFDSCSHGAGRRMSRGEAKKRITIEEHAAATAGVECRKDADVIDESPAAYKSILAVMDAQKDLVEIVHTLKQVVCVKG